MLEGEISPSLENMGIWEEGEEKRLIKQCSLVSGGIVSQRSLLCHTGGYWRDLARRTFTHSCNPGGC